jgi:hypothetical protein
MSELTQFTYLLRWHMHDANIKLNWDSNNWCTRFAIVFHCEEGDLGISKFNIARCALIVRCRQISEIHMKFKFRWYFHELELFHKRCASSDDACSTKFQACMTRKDYIEFRLSDHKIILVIMF